MPRQPLIFQGSQADAGVTAASLADRVHVGDTRLATNRQAPRRRALAAGIFATVCCHSFRATGITVYLETNGTLETAQKIAAHEVAPNDQVIRSDRHRLKDLRLVQSAIRLSADILASDPGN